MKGKAGTHEGGRDRKMGGKRGEGRMKGKKEGRRRKGL